MALTINTNMSSLIVQTNLTAATKSLNQSIERMTTGFKINSAADDAAGYAVATKLDTKLSSVSVCQDNVAIGTSLLNTLSNNYELIGTHLQRIRDLAEEAANGTYSNDSINAIRAEVEARWDEITRIAASCEFNGIALMSGGGAKSIRCGTGTTANDTISLAAGLFANASAATIIQSGTVTDYLAGTGGTALTKASLASTYLKDSAVSEANKNTFLGAIDNALAIVSRRQTEIGASQNRLDSALDALNVQYSNITSSLSTVKDADVAQESSSYIKAQILQQASATLLSTANQAPSIALNLI